VYITAVLGQGSTITNNRRKDKGSKYTMKVIGLTGNVGSGKSTVAKILEQDFNARIIIADELGYMAMQPGESSYQEIVSYFGTEILDEKKEINRKNLANIVFGNDEKLKLLNSIIHPYVNRKVVEIIRETRNEKRYCYVFLESAILIEAGYQNMCDEIWFVSADDNIRRQRLKASRNYSDEKIDSIIKKQMSSEEYSRYSKNIIYNNGNLEEIYKQLKLFLVSET
jgi:dephospho-CoA kinase